MDGWISCLKELGIPEDNPAWTKATPAFVYPEPLAPYSLMILPDFDEKEYVNRLEDDEDVPGIVVAPINEVTNLEEEVMRMAVEGSEEMSTEETREDAG